MLRLLTATFPIPRPRANACERSNLMLHAARRHRITYIGRCAAGSEEDREAPAFLRSHGIEPILVHHPVPHKSGLAFYARLLANLCSPLALIRSRPIRANRCGGRSPSLPAATSRRLATGVDRLSADAGSVCRARRRHRPQRRHPHLAALFRDGKILPQEEPFSRRNGRNFAASRSRPFARPTGSWRSARTMPG